MYLKCVWEMVARQLQGVQAKENDTSRAHCYRWNGMSFSRQCQRSARFLGTPSKRCRCDHGSPPGSMERFTLLSHQRCGPGPDGYTMGRFIQNPDLFDATFFGIAPREASRMDP